MAEPGEGGREKPEKPTSPLFGFTKPIQAQGKKRKEGEGRRRGVIRQTKKFHRQKGRGGGEKKGKKNQAPGSFAPFFIASEREKKDAELLESSRPTTLGLTLKRGKKKRTEGKRKGGGVPWKMLPATILETHMEGRGGEEKRKKKGRETTIIQKKKKKKERKKDPFFSQKEKMGGKGEWQSLSLLSYRKGKKKKATYFAIPLFATKRGGGKRAM